MSAPINNNQTASQQTTANHQNSKCNGSCNNINSNRCCNLKQKTQNQLVNDHKSQKVSV